MNQDIRLNQNRTITQNTTPKKQPLRRINKKTPIVVGIAVLLVVIIGVYLIFFQTGEDLDDMITIRSRIEKHMVLPEGEEPAMATIADKNKVNTPFLKSAENGDKMLVYQNAKKVILYRPSIDRIIDVGPVSIAEPSDQ